MGAKTQYCVFVPYGHKSLIHRVGHESGGFILEIQGSGSCVGDGLPSLARW
jgi:hypothetical protein